MQDLDKLVELLEKESEESAIISYLQDIERVLLTDYFIDVCGIQIVPLWVEAYYFKERVFTDCNSHLSEKQKNRFGQLYFHETGRGGFDICLSKNDNYYLSFLIKAAIVNGEFITQTGIYKTLDHAGVSESVCEQAKNILKVRDCQSEMCILFAERVGLQKPCYKDKSLAAVPLEAITKYDFLPFARKSLALCAEQYISTYVKTHSQCTRKEYEAECRRVFGWLPDKAAKAIKDLI